ncbi:phosphate signaling complex protein PhoU [Rhodococcus qingshengii]|uniref:phosphate signaling complex protein PhoU n=1 Tax=Rhodococcus qingshengii TaxID=334542 RepID=UPI001BECDB84|nr:phosphate signaling complex protein PhoU [Rhodococcus qingshengii]MBT2271633.1 phosphate signaling complex protein PhoU [Rhodococcus qingshengii]
MRTHFADNLDDLSRGLASMCALTVTAMAGATTALLDADLAVSERVLDANAELDWAAADWEHKAFSLLALQAPVAHDLRFTVGGLHIAASVQRMGGLAVHIAKIARLRHPTPAVPPEARACVEEMGQTAVVRATETQLILRHLDHERAEALVAADTVTDELHRRLFTVTQAQEWSYGVQGAVDVTLLGRFYERFCDHTVDIGRRIIFLETGQLPARPEALL